MSVSGMKKQFHKASQLLNEKLMGAEGTRLDEDFLSMEKRVAVINALLAELLSRTTELLQPNPAHRAKLSMLSTVSRIRGQTRTAGYPQTEGILGDCMSSYGQELGAASEFGGALTDVGGALQQVSKARDGLDVSVKRTFIDPLRELRHSELKEIKFHLKKLQGRRLDLDYKRRRRGKVAAEDMRQTWDKFLSSKELSERSMFVLLQNDADRVAQLAALIAALLDFHRDAQRILLGLHGNLQARLTAASNKPERRFRSKRLRGDLSGTVGFAAPLPAGEWVTAVPSRTSSPASVPDGPVPDRPCCQALYSFLPNHNGELRFSEGDIIVLTGRVDANWFEGTLGGRSGLLPVSYVDVLVPLPLP
ncbi:endophilin-A3b [Kryptolebias marmoratus]|uniref:SH3-domain GRB2-like 3b n=1 Tax=Kryptolebias marmoratus TaxID=37003 RepID=A0A3Q3GJE2_KRYMA|nr:endophilin-A3b [Kryptolebias marmoratus]